MLGDFYFDGSKSVVSSGQASKSSSDNKGLHELEFWGDVKAAPSKLMYEAYLKQYPNGHYVPLAKIKLAMLSSSSTGTSSKLQPESNPEVQQFESVVAKIDPQASSDFLLDLTGHYSSKMKGARPYFRSQPNTGVIIQQIGNKISGSFGNNTGTITGRIEGDTINFSWRTFSGDEGSGKWKVKSKGGKLVGTWSSQVGGYDGKWNLTRLQANE